MSDYLPQAALVDILSRLPVKSLLRFRCVCKTWTSLIDAPDFIAAHLRRTSNSQAHLLLRHFSVNPPRECYSLRADNDSFAELRPLKCPFETRSGKFFRIVGSCNGLICLSDDCFSYTYTIILWNPAIRRCVTLPRPKVCFDNYGPYKFALGFGFDHRTNDHKVVRLAYLQSSAGRDSYEVPPKVEVYALRTGKWKTLNATNVRCNLVEYFWSKAFVNGSVHWVAYSASNGVFVNVMLLFDVGREVFDEMPLPGQLVNEYPLNLSAAAYGDSISVFRYENRGPCTSEACEVWIMKEYGVGKSWTKLFNLQLQGGISMVVGFRKNGELLLQRWDKELVSYHPGSKRTRTFGISGGRDSFHLDTYTESLVLLDGSNGVLKKQLKPCDDGPDSGIVPALSKREEAAIAGELEQSLVMHYVFAGCLLNC